ncbi:MAG: MerR family transcriptional regulator [Phycisphaerales bacterium]|nr:MerR family transcriptional regulator [Phycisphaerales bacterium]
MNKPYTIGQIAAHADVATSTVRYYERRGLLRCEGRSRANYRQYGEATLERLRFIRSAQAAGFTLVDIRSLLRFRDGDAAPCRQVQELIAARLDRVRRELAHLREVEQLLQRWSRVCRTAERTGRCGVLERLGRAEKKLSAKSNSLP